MPANPAVTATEQQPKRRRVTLACISCRTRKSRVCPWALNLCTMLTAYVISAAANDPSAARVLS